MAKIKIKCDKCGNQFDIDTNYDKVDENPDRQMGDETIYEMDVDIICPKCGNPIKGKIRYWEYPDGAIDHEEKDLSGGEVEGYGISPGFDQN